MTENTDEAALRRVVVGVDRSENAARAARWAAAEAASILIEAARDTRLLVVGAHRHRGPLSVGAGYTVDGLLAHSPTPVAVVPTH